MAALSSLSERWSELIGSRVNSAREQFCTKGWLYIPSFIDTASLQNLRELWRKLQSSALRKDITINFNDVSSPRRMFTVSAVAVERLTRAIDGLYRDRNLLNIISQITGEQIEPIEDEVEKYVFNWLAFKGDLHGAHVDSFPYACTYTLFAPSEEDGGSLIISDRPEEALSLHGERFSFFSGDLFLFRCDKLFHQVSPLRKNADRVVLNMAYATPETRNRRSYSRASLYS
jgi:hypothetical protein